MLSEAPFLRLLIAFIVGIIVQDYLNLGMYTLILILSCFVFINLYYFFKKDHLFLFKYRFRLNALLLLMITCLAMLVHGLSQTTFYKKNVCHFVNMSSDYRILVNECPTKTASGYRFKGELMAISIDSQTWTCTGKMAVFVQDSTAQLRYGDVLECHAKASPISKAANPFAFDNQQYLARQQINYQLFLRKQQYRITKRNAGNSLMANIYQLRAYLSQCLNQAIEDRDAAAVAIALLLGNDDDIDQHLMQAYSSCGVIHVLSVSGLHVGIFFIIINYLFQFINQEKKSTRIAKTIIIISLIWFYAGLSGFSASVLRSAVMLSFVCFGDLFDRKINILNSLCASCFCLLCFNTNYLFNIGFQLSYIAILGILYLQPLIYGSLYVRNNYLDKIWQMSSVSLAAQLFTFPISLCYFTQFPTLFLLANLLVIPLISIALVLGFIFLVLCAILPTNWFFYAALPLAYCLILINKIIIWIDAIPFSSLKGVFLSPSECILFYACLLMLLLWVVWRKAKLLQWGLALSILLMSVLLIDKYLILQRYTFIVYSLNKMQRVELIHKYSSNVICDKSLEATDKLYSYQIQGFRTHQLIKQAQTCIPKSANYEISFKGQRILYLNKSIAEPLKENYDYLIIGHNAIADYSLIKGHFRQLILDNTNKSSYVKKILAQNPATHDIRTDAAFVVSI